VGNMAQDKQNLDKVNWTAIRLQLNRENLVPFLGAGASLSSDGVTGLPSGSELAKTLAKECDYPGDDKDNLLRVAQYFALKIDETTLRELVIEKLRLPSVQPGEVHKILAGWPLKFVLTTNFDNLMERAFITNGKDADKAIYHSLGDQEEITTEPTVDSPLVYKLHGSIENMDSLILTEDNYVDFLANLIGGNPKIPDKISNIFNKYSLLFIGYGLKDWNIRVLLRYLRRTDRQSFAIQRPPPSPAGNSAETEWESMVLYWGRKNISVYNCDALEFLRELDRGYKEEKPVG